MYWVSKTFRGTKNTNKICDHSLSIDQNPQKNIYVLAIIWGFFVSLFPLAATADIFRFCSEQPPGIESNRLDIENEVVLQKTEIDPRGQIGYIATEYTGAQNLQTSIYLKTGDEYCLIGDLGGATAVRAVPSHNKRTPFPISATSFDGPYKFTRVYRYQRGTYVQSSCLVKEDGKPKRRCTESEK